MTDAASLDPYQDLAGTWIGDQNILEFDCGALRACDYSGNLMGHSSLLQVHSGSELGVTVD